MSTTPVSNLNYLQPTQFRFLADRRSFGSFTFFAQNVTHPGLSTNAANPAFRQYTTVPQPPDTYTYEPLQVNMILDEDLSGYREILEWMKRNVDNEVKPPDDPESSFADLILTIQTNKNTVNKQFKYRNAFPTNISNIDMIASEGDGGRPLVCPVTFAYTYFELV
jgi:hypothetical protein